ncbi:MAG TPA: glycoside hydrolase family 36 protein [Rudaea sp.]|uniref:glycoside hydrolase family 36 protein n=1 Tax=Rudaea sp. TaxID=2136325 RepID=UPI002F9550CD
MLLVCFAAAFVPTLAAATQKIDFGNQDTQLTLQAEASAPRILRLASPAGPAWESAAAEALVDHATVDGATKELHWRFDRAATRVQATSLTLVYETHNPDLRLSWEWQARSQHGPLEHTISIENRSGHEVWIPLQDSFSFDWKTQANQSLQQLWIDKGAGKAPPVGTHLADIGDGYRWLGESSTFAHPRGDEPREIIPYFLVKPADNSASGWYLGVEFSGRIALSLQRHGDTLQGRAGLNPQPGPFRTRLAPGESFVTPTIFLGASRGSIDDAGNTLRRWVREVLNDPRSVRDPTYPWLTNNSWGSGMAIDTAQARRMIDDSHDLGFEMFHLDAGWFRAVGDWYPDAKKFPQGLATIASYAHQHGLKFGLWVDWAQAGNSSQPGAMSVENPAMRDWLTTDPPPGWRPAEFKGITVDIGQPVVQAWVSKEVERVVHDYDLDMLEHDGYVVAQGCDRGDHLHATCDPKDVHRYSDEDFIWMDGPNSSDVSYRATRAYYAIYAQLKRDHPGLLLEICNDGGRMVDFGSAAHGDYFSIIDSYDPLSNRQAFYDASHVLPSAMLETYVKEWPTPRIENFRYMLRSGMMGWFTLMLDTTSWSHEQHDAALAELQLYKTTLRPLIRTADLYHVGPRADGKGWDGIEYFDPKRGKGVVYAFHGADENVKTYTFVLKGLQLRRNYRVRFQDRSSADFVRSGRELMDAGVAVTLPLANSSELVLIGAVQ